MARGTPDWGRVSSGPQAVAELPTYLVTNSTAWYLLSVIPALWIFNPAASGLLVKVRHVLIPVGPFTATGTAEGEVALFRITTEGAGDAIVPAAMDPADPSSGVSAYENASVNPTLGARLFSRRLMFDRSSTIDLARMWSTEADLELFRQIPGQSAKPITVPEGAGLCIQITEASNKHWGFGSILFTEEPA